MKEGNYYILKSLEFMHSGSSIIGMMASKNVKKSWYCEFQVHYRALINLNYQDFPGKYPNDWIFFKNPSNQGNSYSIVTLK